MSSVDVDKIQHRTVRVLTVGQVLSGFGLGSTLSIGALLAQEISGSAAWSGSAATFSTLGAATWAIPLSRLAFNKGRRFSLAAGAGIAIIGAFTVITAAALQFFPILLIGLFFMGAGSAVSLQARFAATDLPTSRNIGRDLSLVVWATTIGAVTGPNLFGPGEAIGHLLHMPKFTGPFVLTVIAQVLAASVFYFGLRPDPLLVSKELRAAKSQRGKTSFKEAFEVIRQYPKAAFAISAIALSHMVMVSVMSMTPVHMKQMGYDLVIVGFTISLHIAGMYAFSPLFGWLSDKLGKVQVVLIGQFIYLFALAFAGFGQHDRLTVTVGLFLLGLGWSASTVSASALLAQTIPAEQKTNVQGMSDSLMNFSGAFGGAIAGSILTMFEFGGLNAAALIPVVLIVVAANFLATKRLSEKRS